ncbi:CD1247 N-terminal domain-containing protein [Clostridium niameyense]|uniref:CD1247 N-terminal domain-containing protein n=1 Tax=Clostridium niameyense TaxID=1622073 RepID=UPI00067F0FE4|nr:CD1247 N-terminal domain-containing protein [Clostridium niameyense]
MKSTISKVAYLRGLMDGLEINKDTKEGRIILEIINILDSLAEEVNDIKESQSILQEYVETIDADLLSLQENIYDEDCEEEDFLEDFIGVECPNCNETIYIDKDALKDMTKIFCPSCHENISLEDFCSCDYIKHENTNND